MQVSVKNIVILVSLLTGMASCGKKEKELSPRQIQEKADSIVRTRIDKLRRQAREDLDRRLPIEIKPKIDSLLKIGKGDETVPVFPEDNTPADTSDAPPPAFVPARAPALDTAKH